MGKRTFMVFGSKFEVDERYTLIKPIGQGSYGIVCSARDALTDSKVAIKKVPKAFEDATDAKRLLREIRLLRHMEHENIINIKDMLVAKRIEDFNDVYIIQELMDTDLYQIICSPQPLSDDHHQYFLYQILRGLKYLHSANVLHRDLKPSNLLVNENCDLKICDFGLARVSSPDDFDTMTEYVVTRWYRPPELLLSARKDYPHQLELITNVLGTPSEKDQAWITNEKARRFMSAMKRKAPQPLKKVFPKATDEALDLLEKMLAFDPAKRITVEGALAHPYLSSLHDADDEPIAPAPFKFEFEGKVLKENDIRKLVYEQAVQIHKEAKGKLKKSKS